jgi:hypothetical protein
MTIFEWLFKAPAAVHRHTTAPLYKERLAFLTHMKEHDRKYNTLAGVVFAGMLTDPPPQPARLTIASRTSEERFILTPEGSTGGQGADCNTLYQGVTRDNRIIASGLN